jgi:hypothetical protein
MFFLRSAFWLTVMFVIIAPRDVDLGRDLDNASKTALAIGQKAIVEQVLRDCSFLECPDGKAALAVLSPTPLPSTEASPEASMLAPIPRPRPDWMG